MQAGTCLLLRVKYDVTVMWRIPPPIGAYLLKCPSFFPLHEIEDILPVQQALKTLSRN